MSVDLPGANLVAEIRQGKTDPFVAQLFHFRLNQKKVLAVGYKKVFESVYLQDSFEIEIFAPGAVQSVIAAGEGFCFEWDGVIVFYVFEINEDGLVLEVDIVEFVNQVLFAKCLSFSSFMIRDTGWNLIGELAQTVHSPSQ